LVEENRAGIVEAGAIPHLVNMLVAAQDRMVAAQLATMLLCRLGEGSGAGLGDADFCEATSRGGRRSAAGRAPSSRERHRPARPPHDQAPPQPGSVRVRRAPSVGQ
jgi:hypothetical protein